MSDLKICAIQTPLHWEDPASNRAMFEGHFSKIKGEPDLVVLPEMFTTGFTMNSAVIAEERDGTTVQWMLDQASKLKAAIYGSVVIQAEGKFFNRGLFVNPSGEVTHYDKRHLFRFANENDHYSAGKERVVIEHQGWRILLQICFDLRFPVFSRNRGDYDLALYVANWPEARRGPWSKLLLARAIENQCYVVGVNRIGSDKKGIEYSGDSVIIDPKGVVIKEAGPGDQVLLHAALNRQELEAFREKFPVGKDADEFDLRL